MINLREHIKLTGVYTFFAAFPAILQLIVYPIIEGTDRLGAEDFGYLAITEAIISFLVMFCLYGMAITIARFYYDYADNPMQYKKLTSTIITGIIGRAIILLIPVIIFSDFWGAFFSHPALQNFNSYGFLLVIIAFNRSIIAVALSLYRSEKNVKNFIAISLISGFFRTTMQIVGVLYFEMSFVGYLAGTAIGGGIASLSVIVYTYSKSGFAFEESLNKTLSKFSRSLFFTDLLFWGILFFDRFLLLKNPVELGIYDNALKFAMGVQFIIQGLSGAVQPDIFRLLKSGVQQNKKDIKSFINIYIAENIAVIGIFVFPIMLFINMFYETELIFSAGIISVILVKYILYAQYQAFSWFIIYEKKTFTYLILNAIVFGIIIISNIILVPYYGFYGSIISFLFAGIFQVIMFYYAQQKITFIDWNKTKILYFPILVVLVSGGAEVLKLYFEINPYLSGFITVFFIFTGLTLLYKRELLSVSKKILAKFL